MTLDASEAALQAACLQLLTLRGCPAWRVNVGLLELAGGRRVAPVYGPDGRPAKGFPDLIAVGPGGRWIGVEVKRPAAPGRRPGRVGPAQLAFHALIRAAGGLALVVADLADLDRALACLAADPHWTPTEEDPC